MEQHEDEESLPVLEKKGYCDSSCDSKEHNSVQHKNWEILNEEDEDRVMMIHVHLR